MKPAIDNKRFQERLERTEEVYVELPEGMSNEQIVVCRTLDMSPAGIRMNIEAPLPEAVVLDLCAMIDDQRYFLKGEIKWQHQSAGLFEIGMELYDAAETDFDRWQQLFLIDN